MPDLTRVRCLTDCPPGDLEQIARIAAVREFPPDTVLFARGDHCAHLFGLLQGSVRVVRGAPAGPATVLDLLGPGALFGEQAWLQDAPHTCSAIATARCRVLAIPALPMRRLMLASAGTANALLGHMSARVERLLDRVERQGSYSAEQQVAAFLLERADAEGLLGAEIASGSRRTLSGYLCLRPETLSRVLSRFRRAGWLLDTGPGRLRVDRAALAARLPRAT